jgi:hypothetical protein
VVMTVRPVVVGVVLVVVDWVVVVPLVVAGE